MSKEEKDTIIPSNEEIINDLTKDLESQFVVQDKENTMCQEDTKVLDGIGKENISSDSNSDTEEPKPDIPDDFIDEVALKDIELNLTDEEKEAKRQEATDLKNQGNSEFKSEKYLESISTYTLGLRTCPLKYENDRSVLYANRAASKIQLGRKESALEDCTKAIELNSNYVRAYLRRAKLYEETDKLDESLADYKKVLELDAANKEAIIACSRLPPLIEERNEKLKSEMLDKLKDLGNMILRPFGLSTDNFQLQKDPNTGGYSVNMQK